MRFAIRTLGISLLFIGLFSVLQAQDDRVFYFGVDLSYVNEMDDCGAEYYLNGEQQDAFALFAESGATLIRARLWHNPDWTDYSTLEDVKRTFQRAQDVGMSTLLDFHYSDNWADPGRQEIPIAWEDFAEDVDALAEAVYQYTYDTLEELHTDGLTPDFVQVGNETNSGMLRAESEDLNWTKQAQLFNAGIQAVRDFAMETNTSPQIILHVAQPENTGWWFREAEAAGITDFDIIGVSYYPQWSTFSVADMGAHVAYLREQFDKDVMVVETAYAWTRDSVDETADNILNQGLRGYAFTPEGQLAFMTDLTQSLISHGALGVVYWEPAWVSTECSTRWGQGSHWENATFFDFQNNNEVLDGINFLNTNYWIPEILVGHVDTDNLPEPFVSDTTGDVFGGESAFDLTALYTSTVNDVLYLTLEIEGDIFSETGNYLIYFDTIQDSGATTDVARRPITASESYLPEYRFDISVKDERGTLSGSYLFNQWLPEEDDWAERTFTGAVAIQPGAPSFIDLQIPMLLLNNPDSINIAVISTDRGRATTASDILGTDFVPSERDQPLILENFFNLLDNDG